MSAYADLATWRAPRVYTRLHVERPEMPRTNDLATDQVSFGERTASMRTGIVRREEAVIEVVDDDHATVDVHLAKAALRQFVHPQDFPKKEFTHLGADSTRDRPN